MRVARTTDYMRERGRWGGVSYTRADKRTGKKNGFSFLPRFPRVCVTCLSVYTAQTLFPAERALGQPIAPSLRQRARVALQRQTKRGKGHERVGEQEMQVIASAELEPWLVPTGLIVVGSSSMFVTGFYKNNRHKNRIAAETTS